MIRTIAGALHPILTFPYIRRTRRNHGLEHATIHMLSRRYKKLSVAGRSDSGGFILLGSVPTEHIEQAAEDALRRMRAGDHDLAVHPNCGTNLVTGALLTSLVALAGFSNLGEKQSKLDRLPLVMAGVMAASIVARPLGNALQKHITTEGDPGDLELVDVTCSEVRLPFSSAPMTVHRVNTHGG